jgi:hypothetical protein
MPPGSGNSPTAEQKNQQDACTQEFSFHVFSFP